MNDICSVIEVRLKDGTTRRVEVVIKGADVFRVAYQATVNNSGKSVNGPVRCRVIKGEQ